MKPIKPLIIKVLFGDLKRIKVLTVILLMGVGAFVLYFLGSVAFETGLPHFSILDPATYLNGDGFTLFNFGCAALLLIYLETLLIKRLLWKKPAIDPISDAAPLKKAVASGRNILLKCFLFLLSIFFSLVPVMLFLIMFETVLLDDASTLDFVIISVSVILMPLIGLITAAISAVVVGGFLSKAALVFAFFMTLNGLFFLNSFLYPPPEVHYAWLSSICFPPVSILPACGSSGYLCFLTGIMDFDPNKYHITYGERHV